MPQNDLILNLKAALTIYGECAKKASVALLKNWEILPGSVALFILYKFAHNLLAPLGMSGGFILGLIAAALLTFYYHWLGRTVQNERIQHKSLLEFELPIFYSTISVGFVLFLIRYVTQNLFFGTDLDWVPMCIMLLTVVVMNPAPEVIYNERMDGASSVKTCYSFVLENWIEWFIPFLVLIAPLILAAFDFRVVLVILSNADPLLPTAFLFPAGSAIFSLGNYYITAAVGLTIATWFMVFRGLLYKELASGSRRRRVYRAKQR